ncbi:DUF802 domain-containing protein [Bordetella genomosp. 4]|uniref:DUF802 domain-containing protein n=1 Tax=Bordetella genomosp. 4 TaxID=463044 RepID=A0A261TVX7_9BORD|nr:DUF802 domain-containing protein [Bordetella genomosp. 4]OZI53150.1 hypothetical protein CAL20_19330 [Bordetella genomosp. 4]
MTRTIISLVVFLAGLAVVGWIGAGYIGTNLLALAIIVLIGLVYLTGVVELQRYQRSTDTLSRAVGGLTVAPSSLDSWLSQLHPSLRGATRLRIEGQRVALPGPTLTPYLVGMLVLLGMLGTFLGMVATLRGTGVALESAVDLQAIRASLAAPVQGLGFAFGTSVAGVATSAALGLLATLCRRSRIQAAQQLDVMIATTLRPYSQNHHGEQTYKLMQQQAEAMPLLVERLQAMMTSMEKQSQALHDRLAASQDAFYGKTESAYTGLASSIEQSLKQSVIDSARMAGEAIQPAVQTTLAGLARETSAWQDTLAIAIRQQLETLSGRFEATTSSVADIWNQALSQQQQANTKLAEDNQRALTAATASLEQHAAALLRSVDQSHAELQNKLAAHDQQRLDTWKASFEQVASGLNTSLENTASSLRTSIAGIASSLDTSLQDTASVMRQEWQQASAHAVERQQAICDTLAQTAQELTAQTQAHARDTITEVSQLLHTVSEAPKAAADVIAELRQSHADLQAQLIAQDQQRLDNWKASLDHIGAALGTSMRDATATLRQEWEHASAYATERQQLICDTLAQTAQELTAQTQAHARDTITEVSQLLHTVSEAPKAAASVIAELRQSHADLQAQLIAQDQQRLDNWKASLDHIASNWNTSLETTAGALHTSMADTASTLHTSFERLSSSLDTSLKDTVSTLRQEWEQASSHTTDRQQLICNTLESTASTLNAALADTAKSLHASIAGITSSLDTSLKDTAAALRQEWAQTSSQAAEHQQAIRETLAQTAQELTSQTQAHARDTITEVSQLLHIVSEAPKAAAEVIAELRQSHADLQAQLIAQDQRRLDNWKATLDDIASTWNTSLESTASTLNTSLQTTATALNDSLEKTTTALNASMEDTAASLNASLTGTTSTLTVTLENTASTLHNSFDDIASSLNVSLENTAYALRQEWEQVSAQTTARQQEICDTLVQTAQELSSQTQAQARDTIAEVAQLVQTAAEAPRAAASVISELRQKLSDGMARDNELLEERNRLMETLSTLLDAVNHASTQQRDAVDSLISNSSELLERVGSQFTDTAQTETVKLTDAAATITGSAVEVASLGEAFGTAVQLFSQSNDKLVEHLERIETALEKSMARSDEQLAYYVAQAREVVDLSVMSQKQIIEDLQLLAAQQTAANSEASA